MTARRVAGLVIRGRVQGVGYRDWMARAAEALGLEGWVRNRRDGTVEAVVAGPAAKVAALVDQCRQGPRLAQVTAIEEGPADPPGPGFRILPTA